MAADTPVLENTTTVRRRDYGYTVPTHRDFVAEEDLHNARIKDTYARLINPDNRIEDVFGTARAAAPVQESAPVQATAPVAEVAPSVRAAAPQIYRVENARADSVLFRADSTINRVAEEAYAPATIEAPVAQIESEEEDEDLRPTPTTIQYQTIGEKSEQVAVRSIAGKRQHVIGKKEKIIIAVAIAIVVALIALVIVNSTIIANLNEDIADVQAQMTTVRGALAGVNATIEEVVPESIRNLIIK